MSITIDTICCGQLQENAYLVYADDREDCLLIDPGDGLSKIRKHIADSGRKLTDILLTHAHFDHMLSAPHMKRFTGARLHLHENDDAMLRDPALNLFEKDWCMLPLLPVEADDLYTGSDDSAISVCGLDITVLRTPGHTPGSVCYLLADEKIMFSGDTLFAQGYGRVDFPGGNVKDMTASLKRLVHMDQDIMVYSGHGPAATIGQAMRGLMR